MQMTATTTDTTSTFACNSSAKQVATIVLKPVKTANAVGFQSAMVLSNENSLMLRAYKQNQPVIPG
jgi:hypothetical protein